jgi:solute carrier family 25 thiamine pyrophosphate transporter 19
VRYATIFYKCQSICYLALHFVCGGVSGCCATLCAQPLDVLRTRLVAQGEPKIYRNFIHAFASMYQKEGGRSLYKGLTPTLLQIFPHAGCQFGFYELFRKIWNLWKGHRQALKNNVGTSESLLCGASAGICSKAAVYPLDLIKKRFQVCSLCIDYFCTEYKLKQTLIHVLLAFLSLIVCI